MPSRSVGAALLLLFAGVLVEHGSAQATLGPASVRRVASPVLINVNVNGAVLGKSVAGLGDVNGDGIHDFAVSAPGAARVYIFSGANRAVVRILTDPHPWLDHAFGYAIDGVGDVDGDAVEDLGVGAPNISGSPAAPCVADPRVPGSDCLEMSQAYVMSGATGAMLTRLVPGRTPVAFGFRIVGLGDISGDGIPDVAVSDPALNAGLVSAFSGGTGAELWATPSDNGFLEFGVSLASAADADRDGRTDVLASVIDARDAAHGVMVMNVWLLSSADGHMIRGHAISDPRSGLPPAAGLADVGDQDGDNIGDYVTANPKTRHVWVWSGADGRGISEFDGPFFSGEDDAFGWAIVSVGDKDGDHLNDFWVAAPGDGLVFLVNRYGMVLAGATDPTPPPAAGSSRPGFGHHIAAIGNIGGDAGPDLIVGEPGETAVVSPGPGGSSPAVVLHDVGAAHVVMLPARKS